MKVHTVTGTGEGKENWRSIPSNVFIREARSTVSAWQAGESILSVCDMVVV